MGADERLIRAWAGLSPSPPDNSRIFTEEYIAQFFGSGGVACACVGACVAPQVVRYDLVADDIFSVTQTKLKKIAAAFSMREHVSAVIDKSTDGDFSLVVARSERAPLYLYNAPGDDFFNNALPYSCVLGRDTNADPVTLNIADAPHVLIAGTTGSGKSVLLNTMISSLLATTDKQQGQFIMIDPKQVELTQFSRSRSLYKPIITDVKNAVATLENLCAEMDRRYKKLSFWRYKQLSDAPRPLFPRIFVVIDELADLMLTSKKSVEKSIIRIAQLGRACGIHLIIATQRPTTNIITGLIKANIPTKIALSVPNISDSVTILNHGGAEKLLGRGDAIIKTPDTIETTRFQAAFTPDEDIQRVVSATGRKGLIGFLRQFA